MCLFLVLGHKCHPNPASDFLGFRRKTNSYVGKPILTSDFVGFFFWFFSVVFCFFCHILEFSKRFGFYMCFFVFFGFVGVKVHYIFVFFLLFGFGHLFFLVFRFFTLILSFLDSGAKVDKTTQLIFKMEFTKTKDRTDFL